MGDVEDMKYKDMSEGIDKLTHLYQTLKDKNGFYELKVLSTKNPMFFH